MIASTDGEAVAVHRARNTAASPFRYEMDGMEQYRIQTEIEDAGHELGAIYHSHTRSAPEPSQTDINLAFYPEALYVIVGLKGTEPDVRAWRIVDGRLFLNYDRSVQRQWEGDVKGNVAKGDANWPGLSRKH